MKFYPLILNKKNILLQTIKSNRSSRKKLVTIIKNKKSNKPKVKSSKQPHKQINAKCILQPHTNQKKS